MQSFERPVSAHSVKLALTHGYVIRFKDAVEVAQHPWAETQSTLIALEREQDGYYPYHGIEEQQRGGFEALHRGLRSPLVHHTSLVDLVGTHYSRIWTVILGPIDEQFLPQCAIVRPAFVLGRPKVSRCVVRRFARMFCPYLCILMVI